jgi:hypothetical protein
MLEKGNATNKDQFIDMLMNKKDQGNECIIKTMKGDFYGRIISVGLDKVNISQDGKNISIDVDYILEVE